MTPPCWAIDYDTACAWPRCCWDRGEMAILGFVVVARTGVWPVVTSWYGWELQLFLHFEKHGEKWGEPSQSETWKCCWLLNKLKASKYLGIPRELGFLVTFVICDLTNPLIESSHCHRWTQTSKPEQGSVCGSHSLRTSRGLNKPGLWSMSSTTSLWRNFMAGRRWTGS